jgi:predicted RND superfamily exporter protein
MTLIVVELLDQKIAKSTYFEVMELVSSIEGELGENQIFVSGEGATTGFLSAYIEKDAKRLNPITGIIILIILIIAFYTFPATTIPLVIVAGTVNMSLGLMAFFNVEYYVITNGLIVCMIGIAVADSIHFFSEYYKNIKGAKTEKHSDIIVKSMTRIFNPVTLTSITTAVGFLSLYPSNSMPPLKYFGIFGGLAVMIAWFLTMTLTPSLVSLFKMKQSLLYKDKLSQVHLFLPKLLYRVTLSKPRLTLIIFGVLFCVGIFFTTKVITNEERIENLQPTEKIYQSDKSINRAMDGTYYVDLIIETNKADGVLDYELLASIEKLQLFLDSEENIQKSVSIVDFIKKMNKALNEGAESAYIIPPDSNLIAQLFLLYSLSGSPTDFENVIDSNRESAIVRAYMKSSSYLTSKELIPRIEHYIEANMKGDVEVNISGRVLVDYHLVKSINGSHVKSVLLAFALVILIAALLFRSLLCGLYIAFPVGLSILTVYTVRGVNGIWLGIGTAMFASIAIGLSIDFAIHLMDFFIDRNEVDKEQSTMDKMDIFFDATGRALWFNLLTIGLGFSVLIFSTVPSLHNFGVLVTLALGTAFCSTIMLLPCLLEVFKPKFIYR